MNLNRLKADLANKNGILSCVNYDLLVEAIDFKKLEELNTEARSDYGLFCWGEPALSIEQTTARICVRGLLVPDVGIDLVEFGITGYDVIEHYINYANSLPQVSNIVLDIDSGGGYAKGVQHCADVIMRSEKPISTFVSGDMYSAAYWLGCSTGYIEATPYAGIGSIGVYTEHFDRSKQLENMGIVARIFRSSKWKGAFSSNRPLTEEEQVKLQQNIDDTADDFFTHVAQMRNLSKKAVADFDGDMFAAEEALELGLIDRIENVNQTDTGEEIKMEKDVKAEQAQVLTPDQIEQIKAQAYEEAKAEMQAKAEREKQINSLEVNDSVKVVLASDDFASVSIAAMGKLVAAMPKGFSQAMDEIGGAGVEADPKAFAPKTKEQEDLDKQAEALAKLQALKGKGL